MAGRSKATISSYVKLYVVTFVQDASVAFLLLYFVFIGVEIVRPGTISLFIDVNSLLYLAGAAIALLMITIRFTKVPYVRMVQNRRNNWVWPFISSAILGLFTAWQVRGSTSYAILIGTVTGLLVLFLSRIMIHSDDVESDQE